MLRSKKTEMGIPGGLALGILVSITATFTGAAVFALLIAGGTAGEGSAGIGTAVIRLLSAALGALTATGCIRKLRLQIGLLSGLVYYLVLMGLNALLFEGEYAGLGIAALSVLIGCGGIVLLPLRKKRPVTSRRWGRRK